MTPTGADGADRAGDPGVDRGGDHRADRGRDPDGRPRQQRPRDALGRPLPFGAQGVEPIPEEALPPLETLARARELIDSGRAFGAHEVLEARWKAGPDSERDFWQGLAQLCVALTHHARGNAVGATRLLERGAERLAGYSGPKHGFAVAEFIDEVRATIGQQTKAAKPASQTESESAD
ncbi:MAG: DUF309 domain-containing protein [Propionibacteriaceae bacterium]|nr:DUF309 domain-containing protein [Propionibacteriaceae bacterium]